MDICTIFILVYFSLFVSACISLGTQHVVPVPTRDLAFLSRNTIGSGLGVACETTISTPDTTFKTTTDGPCNPDSPDISGVEVCHAIGRPQDAGIDCLSLTLSISFVVLSGMAFIGLVALTIIELWNLRRQRRTLLPNADNIALMPQPTKQAPHDLRRMDSASDITIV